MALLSREGKQIARSKISLVLAASTMSGRSLTSEISWQHYLEATSIATISTKSFSRVGTSCRKSLTNYHPWTQKTSRRVSQPWAEI